MNSFKYLKIATDLTVHICSLFATKTLNILLLILNILLSLSTWLLSQLILS